MDKHIEELLPFYALGALTDEERELVESYLGEHPEVRAEIEGMDFAASALPYGMPPVEPSERPKKALMARVEADQRTRNLVPSDAASSRPARAPGKAAGFPSFAFGALSMAVAVAAIALMIIQNGQISRLQNEVSALRTAVLAQAGTVDQLNQALDEVNARLPLVTPSALTLFDIKGTTVQPDAHGQLIFDPNNHSAVLVVTALAPPEPGKTYQVWLIEGETPKSAGLLSVDSNGQGIVILNPQETIASFDAVGISIEPETGSLQPTGDIVMLGKFN
jgi:anti-sigma-K factor RskA